MDAIAAIQSGVNPAARCFLGFVRVTPTGLLGATNGFLFLTSGGALPITQVVGPAGGLVSLNAVDRRFAILCGSFTPSPFGGVQLNVSSVIPLRR